MEYIEFELLRLKINWKWTRLKLGGPSVSSTASTRLKQCSKVEIGWGSLTNYILSQQRTLPILKLYTIPQREGPRSKNSSSKQIPPAKKTNNTLYTKAHPITELRYAQPLAPPWEP